ncbi:lytic transglycosylase [Celeribacter baekdonensis]|uniref:Lytic transglycosylase n=1 Tax=Celeribacter baekdonensis TaxID=875171 RepID=A0A2R4M6F5_9RHOB|nr:lytic transglycosylase [Celeribacter baekdonensis]AVW92755.1 lytic transglycosylase [Celeribacter baekdonensis]
MSRRLRAVALLLLVSACGSGNFSAPRELENACAIVSQRPTYLRAMKATERKWGIPVNVQMATFYQESKFIGNARTPYRFVLGVIPMGRQSSAYGYAQALDATWDEYRREQKRWSAKRDRIQDATDFMGWYMDKSTSVLGISKQDATSQYLAYHEGRTGYSRGSYRAKAWLMRVSTEVGARSATYRQQLIACRQL